MSVHYIFQNCQCLHILNDGNKSQQMRIFFLCCFSKPINKLQNLNGQNVTHHKIRLLSFFFTYSSSRRLGMGSMSVYYIFQNCQCLHILNDGNKSQQMRIFFLCCFSKPINKLQNLNGRNVTHHKIRLLSFFFTYSSSRRLGIHVPSGEATLPFSSLPPF